MTATGADRENVHRFDSSKTARRIMSEQTRDNFPPDYCEPRRLPGEPESWDATPGRVHTKLLL